MPFYGGLDWGGIAHAICVVDGAGQVVACIDARHDNAGLVDMLIRLRKIALPTEMPITSLACSVAIECPSGRPSTRGRVIVDVLIKAGRASTQVRDPVIPIHPNSRIRLTVVKRTDR